MGPHTRPDARLTWRGARGSALRAESPPRARSLARAVSPGRAAMPEHVRACLSYRDENVADAVVHHSEVTQRVPKNAAHHRYADRLTRKREAELDVHGRLLSTGHGEAPPPQRPPLSPVNLVTL